MIGAALVLAGVASGVVGWLLLRRSGSGWRVGRLLAAAPLRTLEEARALAGADAPAYVKVHGRVDSDEEFPGDGDRPIVYRRRRLQHGGGRGGWRTFDDERTAVPFGLTEKGQRILVDGEALGDGLVVVPRLAEGVAGDLPADGAGDGDGPERPDRPDLPPSTPVRLRIEQVSSIDHATVAGVPRLDDAGQAIIGPGLGRPLILTTLEPEEAMRVLASERRGELLLASGLLVAAPLIVLAGLIVGLAAS